MKELTYHPVADMFPLIEGPEFDDLVEDIRQHGQRHSCVKAGTQIIDGRNRYRACGALGIECQFEEWDGEGSLTELSASLNLHRRHLTTSQRSASAAAVADGFEAEAAERMRAGKSAEDPAAKSQQGRSAERAARLCRVSPRSVYDARLVRKESPELFAEVLAGKTGLAVATRAVHRNRKADHGRQGRRGAAQAGRRRLPDRPRRRGRVPGEPVERDRAAGVLRPAVQLAGSIMARVADATSCPRGRYLAWCYVWLREAVRCLTANGSLFVMIDGRGLGDMIYILEFLGLHRRNLIVWHETFGTYTDDNFTPCARFILYYTRDAKRFVFDGDAIRVPSDRQAVYGDKRADPAGKVPGNVWQVPRLADNHPERAPDFPTQVPLSILMRIVLAASEAGDLVVDGFSGSGTTAEAAVTCGRRFAGCDNHKPNVEAGLQRVARAIARRREATR